MEKKFRTPGALMQDGSYDVGADTVEALLSAPKGWDFVVMNTYSQDCAMPSEREASHDALGKMAPLIDRAAACPIMLVTPAYRAPTKGSERIGDWQDFTWKQSEGMVSYAQRLAKLCSPDRHPRIADANRAFELVHGERPELWERLFHTDDFHPSALGSFLEACVIFCAIFGQVPPLPTAVLEEPRQLWARARFMLPPPLEGEMPTADELVYLRGVAARISGHGTLIGV